MSDNLTEEILKEWKNLLNDYASKSENELIDIIAKKCKTNINRVIETIKNNPQRES